MMTKERKLTVPGITEISAAKATKKQVDSVGDIPDEISLDDALEVDERLRGMKHDQVLTLDSKLRLRWFYLMQVKHRELNRVYSDLSELLDPSNEVNIISLIGMTGIGKTTLANGLLQRLVSQYEDEARSQEVPFIYVKAPANGDRSMSWRVLYKSILTEGHEILLRQKRGVEVTADGKLQFKTGKRATLAELREFINEMLKRRKVRVLVIDEALHLLRFEEYGAIMDTLKSLADAHHTKLILIGSYDIADLVSEYGQVVRRGEIVHYHRYQVGKEPGNDLTSDQEVFRNTVKKFQSLWPCATIPNLDSIWFPLMRTSLGSVGLLKICLLRMASLQIRTKNEKFSADLLRKSMKNPKALQQIETETIRGEQKIAGTCYGDSIFSDAELADLMGQVSREINV
jgi:energy-coupling factor transporter ATP-binding protein EcfA2